QPASTVVIELQPSIVAGRDGIGTNLPCRNQELIELQMIVAEAAWDRRAPGKILVYERTHHVALETLLVIDYVIRNSNRLRHPPRVINIVKRAATSLYGFRHSGMARQPPLVPKLHREADNLMPFGTEHSGDGGGVNPTRHGNADGLPVHTLALWLPRFSAFRYALAANGRFFIVNG